MISRRSRVVREGANFGMRVQRSCGCGGTCQCDESKKARHNAVSEAITPEVAPPIVHRVLAQQGQPIDVATRSHFESRLKHDFSSVRVHRGDEASLSAEEINARAYTVGNHIVLGRGATSQTFAHELVHTIQQRPGTVSGPLPIGPPHDALEREAEHVARSASVHYGKAPESQLLQREPYEESILDKKNTPKATCDRTLTWRDFPEVRPATATSGAARTEWAMSLDSSVPIIKATLTKKSGVRDKERSPTDRNLSGCGKQVTDCESWFVKNAGGTYSLGASTGCTAAFSPDVSVQATSKPECSSVLGTECDRVAVLNSERLLRHEQYHWNIVCLFTGKGNAAIAAGADPTKAFNAAFSKASDFNDRYDTDSNHGCIAAGQKKWETDVDGGFPKEIIAAGAKPAQKPAVAPPIQPPKRESEK